MRLTATISRHRKLRRQTSKHNSGVGMGGHFAPYAVQYVTKTVLQCDTDRIALLFYADRTTESTLSDAKRAETAEKTQKIRGTPMFLTYRFTMQQNTILPNGNEAFRFTAARHFLCIAPFSAVGDEDSGRLPVLFFHNIYRCYFLHRFIDFLPCTRAENMVK